MRSRLLCMGAAALPLAACVAPADDAGDVGEPPADVPAAAATDEPGPMPVPTTEGARGKVWARTLTGLQLLEYVVEGGRAIHDGDLDLGPVSRLPLWGGAIDLDNRWTNGTVRFAFHPDFAPGTCDPALPDEDCVCGKVQNGGVPSPATPPDCVNARDRVRAVIDELDAVLPVEFVELAPGAPGNYILIQYNDDPSSASGGYSPYGMLDEGEQHLTFRVGHAGDDSALPVRAYNLQPKVGTTRHELLHSLGYFHEQVRGDRDQFIEYRPECLEPDAAGEPNEESADLGPYDFPSIMHYPAKDRCLKWSDFYPPEVPDPDGDTCLCVPTAKWVEPPTPVVDRCNGESGIGTPDEPGQLSCEDINVAYQIYAQPGGTNTAGDAYGKAVAIGDFDADGYDDLAVGIPHNDGLVDVNGTIVTHPDAGSVLLYKGTVYGLIRWKTVSELSVPGQVVEADEHFGAALAAGDFNRDGTVDLAIGAPGERTGGIDAGAVFVFEGVPRRGLEARLAVMQINPFVEQNHSGDRYGAALAIGDFGGFGGAGLAVGAPGNRTSATAPRTGSAFLYRFEKDFTIGTIPTRLVGAAANDQLGAAFAVLDVDGDQRDDLVVGAPGAREARGRIYLYKGRSPTLNPPNPAVVALQTSKDGPALDARFGAALAAGRVEPGRFGQRIAVGAPGVASNRGQVTVLDAAADFTLPTVATLQDSAGSIGATFGAALAIANVDDTTAANDLVIGAPGQRGGRVFIARSLGATLTTTLRQTDLANDEDAADRFGEALAVGHLDGWGAIPDVDAKGSDARRRLDLAIGAPGEAPDIGLFEDPAGSGAVFVYRGVKDQLAAPMKIWHQELTGGI